MTKFMGDGFDALPFVERINELNGGGLICEAKSCGWMFFPAPVPSPVGNHLYPDVLHIRSRFVEKFRQGFRF
jgi:hypothetical protein